jgi:hypothetical protein
MKPAKEIEKETKSRLTIIKKNEMAKGDRAVKLAKSEAKRRLPDCVKRLEIAIDEEKKNPKEYDNSAYINLGEGLSASELGDLLKKKVEKLGYRGEVSCYWDRSNDGYNDTPDTYGFTCSWGKTYEEYNE